MGAGMVNFHGVGLGTSYAITADSTQANLGVVSTTITPAPEAWRLRDPAGADASSLLTGSGGTRTFVPTGYGAWVVEGTTAAGVVLIARQVVCTYPSYDVLRPGADPGRFGA